MNAYGRQDDEIKVYVLSTKDGVYGFCYTCDRARKLWAGETEGGDTITCCGYCSRVITRIRTDQEPK